MTADLRFFLSLGAALFAIGAFGFLTRRNLLVMFLSAELMVLGVAVNFVAFGHRHGSQQGQAFALFVLAVAACESALALTFTIGLYRRKGTLDAAVCNRLGETHAPPPADLPDDAPPPPEALSPRLAPAGHEPKERRHV